MDSNEQPTHDGYETGRSYSSVEISRKVKEAAISPLQHDLLTAIQRYERDFAAANSSPTVATLLNLAESYDRATADYATDAHREDLAAEVAEELSLAEAGTIRRAAKAVELGMPGIICRARADGMTPNEIARQLGATGSYVRRILRENRTTLAEAVASLSKAGRKFGETVAKTAAAVEAATGEQGGQQAAERAVFWTIQRWEGDYWHELTAQSTTTTTTPNAFARDRLAAARKTETGSAPLRCRVWPFGESEGEPLAEATD